MKRCSRGARLSSSLSPGGIETGIIRTVELSRLAIDQTDSWPIICIFPQHTSLIHVYKYKSYVSANIGFYGYACIIITTVGASRASINKSRAHAVSHIMRIVE